MNQRDEVALLVSSSGGAIRRRDHPDLTGRLDRMLRSGELTALFPGVYAPTANRFDTEVRIRAASLWAGPDAVVTGRAAARLTFWSECSVGFVTLAAPSASKRSRHGVQVEQRRIPPELIAQTAGLRVTCPSLTAVDLAAEAFGGEAIDRVLRTKRATLAELWEVMADQKGRRGNRTRSRLLRDSRDEPWSEAERLLHRLLREADIAGWRSNVWVPIDGSGYYADVLFDRQRLILEVDGWEIHGGRETFETDRVRRNALVLAGYVVLNFTWRQLTDSPAWVLACIRQAC